MSSYHKYGVITEDELDDIENVKIEGCCEECDSYIASANWIDGPDLSGEELDYIRDNYPDWIEDEINNNRENF